MDLVELFCKIDDFCILYFKNYSKHLLESGSKKYKRPCRMQLSEIMTLVVYFHLSGYKNLKHFYLYYVCKYLRKDFPYLVSYNRFVELQQQIIMPLIIFLKYSRGEVTGISFADATKIQVCNYKRISRNKVFENLAKIGKTTMGWFFGFKLHLIVNDKGEILNFCFTAGNAADVKQLKKLVQDLNGKLFADKAYINNKLSAELLADGIQLITPIKSNMKNKFVSMLDKILLRKRSIIETINDQLKNICQLEHSRHRSVKNFVVNVLSALAAYVVKPKKPALKWSNLEMKLLAA